MISFGGQTLSPILISTFDPHSVAPTKHISDPMSLIDSATRSGSVWVRDANNAMALAQTFSDFYSESLSDSLAIINGTSSPVERPVAASDTMTLSDGFVAAGTAVGGGTTGDASKTISSVTNDNAGSLTKGTPVYSSSSGGVDLAQADAGITHMCIGLVNDSIIASAANGDIITAGVLVATTAQWDVITGGSGGLTFNTLYYLSAATAGKLTTTAPTTTGHYIEPIGIAISATEMEIIDYHSILL